MADKIKFYRDTYNKIKDKFIENGSIYFTTDTSEIYMDYSGQRIKITPEYSLTTEDNQIILKDKWGKTTSVPLVSGAQGPKGDKGDKGEKGDKGDPGTPADNQIYMGTDEPTNHKYLLWIDTNQ